jgi:GDP-D-mannose dehydratase
MLQQKEAEDFVLATGETHPVREYVEKAFACVGVKLRYGSDCHLNFSWLNRVRFQMGRHW